MLRLKERVRAPLQIFVLAGGKSSRMGGDKSRLLLGSKTFLQRIIATALDLEAPVEVVTKDDEPGLGPMGGVVTALNRSQSPRVVFLSCDMPLLSSRWLQTVARHKTAFTSVDGEIGFPFVVPRSSLSVARQSRSIREFCDKLRAERLEIDPAERWRFANVNTPTEYKAVLRLWQKHHRSNAVLELRNLTIRRGPTPMISGLSWKVQKREHWAVLGPNGCGKTTLFSALLGYLAPTRGDIFLMGEEFGDSDWPRLRLKIGLVSSSIRQMMPDHEPAWITVASGKYAMIDYWGTPSRADRKAALELLRQNGCEYIADRPWAVLSQGERQRVLIARALMTRPALLILDEPCAGLDPAARERFLGFLQRLGTRRDSPNIVLVTHHVEEIMPFITHAMLLKGGQKLVEGPVVSTLTSETLSKTFDASMTLERTGARYALKVSSEVADK